MRISDNNVRWSVNDAETINLSGVSNKTNYKYKKQLLCEETENQQVKLSD